jgi:hypothetical protein
LPLVKSIEHLNEESGTGRLLPSQTRRGHRLPPPLFL